MREHEFAASEIPARVAPYQHQVDLFRASWDKTSYAIFGEMGTGKSATVIHTLAELFARDEVRGCLIVAPKGAYRNWSREILAHMPLDVPREVSIWAATARKPERLQLARSLTVEPTKTLKICLMNVESFSTPKGAAHAKKFLETHDSMMVVDESTSIKTPSAKRTKAIIRLGKLARYRRILTGSPLTNSPLDLYAQAAFLDPALLGFSSYYTFRNRYAKMKDGHSHGRSYKTVVGYRHLKELQWKLEGWSSRILKADCLDLPPKIYLTRDVELTAEQKTAYDSMRLRAIATLNGAVVTAPQVITQIMRLHQITCGHLTVDGQAVELPSRRLEEMMNVVEEQQGSTIIWATYRADIQRITKKLIDEYGWHQVVTYYGSTSDEEREEAIAAFQAGRARFFVANPKTGGYGITLTAASNVIYYSNDYNLETRLQSEDRCHRIGQDRPVTYVDLVCRDTVDEKILGALRGKLLLSREVLGDAWTEWL